MGLCEYIVENDQSRQKAEELAHQIAKFPQICVQADRRSVYAQEGLSMIDALKQEWFNGKKALSEEGLNGAKNFKKRFWEAWRLQINWVKKILIFLIARD